MSGNQGEEDPLTLVDSDNYSWTPAGEENVPALLEESGEEDLTFLKGNVYPLNSRRLVASQLHRLAGILGLPTSSSLASTRQLIEGKLLEMGCEPKNVQVIESDEDARLYLVTDDGVISEESAEVNTHVSDTSGAIFSHIINNNESSVHELESLRSALREARLENEDLKEQMLRRNESEEQLRENLSSLQAELQQLRAAADAQVEELAATRKELRAQTLKAKRFWSQKCEQLLLHEAAIEEKEACIVNKDAEIALLWGQLQGPRNRESGLPVPPAQRTAHHDDEVRFIPDTELSIQSTRRGKAPPINPFRGNDPDVRLDDWLPTLECAATWNGWSDDEKLIQLAGYLRGKAAREYALLSSAEKQSFALAVEAL